MYFMLPKCLYYIKKKQTNACGFILSDVTFFFITVSYPNMTYDDHLGFIGHQLIMNAETLPCTHTMHMAKKHIRKLDTVHHNQTYILFRYISWDLNIICIF
jgi:hypothetical protein